MDKHNVVHVHTGMLLHRKTEGGSKPLLQEGWTPRMWCSGREARRRRTHCLILLTGGPRGVRSTETGDRRWGQGLGSQYFIVTEFLFGKMRTFWRWQCGWLHNSVNVLNATECALKNGTFYVMYILPHKKYFFSKFIPTSKHFPYQVGHLPLCSLFGSEGSRHPAGNVTLPRPPFSCSLVVVSPTPWRSPRPQTREGGALQCLFNKESRIRPRWVSILFAFDFFKKAFHFNY